MMEGYGCWLQWCDDIGRLSARGSASGTCYASLMAMQMLSRDDSGAARERAQDAMVLLDAGLK